MTNKTIVLFVIIFALIVGGMFMFTYIYKQQAAPIDPILPPDTTLATTTNKYGITRIEGKHFFINGVHTIVGEIAMPTPCDLLTTDAMIAESYPEQVTFNFSVINNTTDCAQIVTNQRFKIDANASKDALISARFMGQPVELNLVEASPNETPDSFELFIKG